MKKVHTFIHSHSSLIFLGLGILFFFGFVLFTFLVRADLLRQFDFNMTVRLQDDIPLRFDEFFSTLSVIGRFEWMIVMLVIFLIVRRKIIGGMITVGLFGLAHIIELVGKKILEQPGPPRMFLRAQFGEFPGLHIFTDASYPSGHSLRIVFLAILIIAALFRIKKIKLQTPWVRTLLKHDNKLLQDIGNVLITNIIPLGITFGIVVLTGIMLVSRVSLGEHWTSDVIGGSILGISFAFFAIAFL